MKVDHPQLPSRWLAAVERARRACILADSGTVRSLGHWVTPLGVVTFTIEARQGYSGISVWCTIWQLDGKRLGYNKLRISLYKAGCLAG